MDRVSPRWDDEDEFDLVIVAVHETLVSARAILIV
jgi:hypothetical protein